MPDSPTIQHCRSALDGVDAASRQVVVLGVPSEDPWVRVLAESLPDATIHLLVPRNAEPTPVPWPNVTTHRYRPLPEQAAWVVETLRARPRVVIDRLSCQQPPGRTAVRRLLWSMDVGGLYALRLRPAEGAGLASATDALRVMVASSADPGDTLDPELERSIATAELAGDTVLVRKANSHLFSARQWPTATQDASLDISERIHTQPGYVYPSRATVHVHGRPATANFHTEITVPDLHVRRHDDATCYPRMIAVAEGRVLPSSFRHPHNKRLTHPRLVNSGPDFVRHGREYERLPHLSGTYLQLDSTFPGHFGHVLTEQMSHLWAWDVVRQRFPETRIILTLPPRKREVPAFLRQLLSAFGIGPERVVTLRSDQSVTVETLLTCTPAFENPHFVDLGMIQMWDRLHEHLAREPDYADGPVADRIFVARPPGTRRAATNARAIERFFRRRRFRLVRPEQLSWAQQARLFSRAKVIAGYGGSGMFNMMFNPDARIIIVTSDAYTARNEHLFAAARGNEIHYFFGSSTIPPKPARHDRVSFVADFDFDLRGRRGALAASIRS